MIDWEKVEELRADIGEDDFFEVVELFLDEVQEGIDRLGANPAADTLEEEYHALKGSGLNLGFRDFAQICAKAESDAASGAIDQIDHGAAAACYHASREAFLDKLQPSNAA